MGKDEPIVTLKKIRDELILISQKIKKGELSPNTANAVVNALRSAGYIEQIRIQQEKDMVLRGDLNVTTDLSPETKAKLDEIAKLLVIEEPSS